MNAPARNIGATAASTLGQLIAASNSAAELVARAGEDQGGAWLPNEGGLALAEWIVAAPFKATAALDRAGIPGETVVRMLAGTLEPALELGSQLNSLTDGAITAAKFRRPVSLVEAGHASPSARAGDFVILEKGERSPQPLQPVIDPPELLCAIPGLVGETPSGPLYRAIVDPLSPRQFVVAGMGHAFALDRGRGQALLDAVADGLAQVTQ